MLFWLKYGRWLRRLPPWCRSFVDLDTPLLLAGDPVLGGYTGEYKNAHKPRPCGSRTLKWDKREWKFTSAATTNRRTMNCLYVSNIHCFRIPHHIRNRNAQPHKRDGMVVPWYGTELPESVWLSYIPRVACSKSVGLQFGWCSRAWRVCALGVKEWPTGGDHAKGRVYDMCPHKHYKRVSPVLIVKWMTTHGGKHTVACLPTSPRSMSLNML